MKWTVIVLIIASAFIAEARLRLSDRLTSDPESYAQLVNTLIRQGHYFSAIPFAKEVLSNSRSRRGARFHRDLEKLIAEIGVRQFETLPGPILARSGARVVRYIRAKKLFRKGRYARALEVLRGIPMHSSIGPFVYMLKGSIYSILGKQRKAIDAFEECASESGDNFGDIDIRRKQYQVTQDYCIIGRARALFALRRYDEASSAYLDLEKSSFIWPEILFEEAWSSFFQKNYNRTLGKLVTYKAPVFQNFFIPEIDILKALTYMELCLWADAKRTIDLFEKEYLRDSRELGKFLKRKGRNFEYFYRTSRKRRRGPVRGGGLYNQLLRSVVFEPGYQELNNTMDRGLRELRLLRNSHRSQSNRIIISSIEDTLQLQKRLIGSYVRKQLIIKYALLRKAFTDLGYIKLEILKRNKRDLYYREGNHERKRGDIKYLSRSEKQYFWGFNGEFWADEMGDYVFALPSECRR